MPPKNASTSASTNAKKVAAKPAASRAKSGGAKSAASKGKGKGKTTNAEKAAKTKEETERYKAAVAACCAAGYINDFDALNAKSFHEKCAHAINMYILETINNIQKVEVHGNKANSSEAVDAYPPSGYILLDDKLSGSSAARKKAPNTTGKSGELPKQKRLPKKRGQKVDEPTEETEATDEVEVDVETTSEADGDAEAEPSEQSGDSEEKKAPAKKNVVQINKNGKTMLGFIVNRFTDEIYSTNGGKQLKTDEDFTKFVLTNVSKDTRSQLTRTIVPTVNRLSNAVSNMKDHDFVKHLTTSVGSIFEDDGRPSLAGYLVRYLTTYFKLLGTVLGQQVWLVHRGINGASIEAAMRVLDIGNNAYLVDHKYCGQDENDYGLSQGALQHGRLHDLALNPPLSEEEKKARNAKRAANGGIGAKGKGKKTSEKKTVSTDGDAADAADAEEEEPEAEAEVEEEEPEAETETAEEEAEPEEETAADQEEEAEPEPVVETKAPPKQTRKLTVVKK